MRANTRSRSRVADSRNTNERRKIIDQILTKSKINSPEKISKTNGKRGRNHLNKISEPELEDIYNQTKNSKKFKNSRTNLKILSSIQSTSKKQFEPTKIVDQTCSICMDNLINKAVANKCSHEFCKDCIEKWTKLASSCPLCKETIEKITYYHNTKKVEKIVYSKEFNNWEEEYETWYEESDDNCMKCHSNINNHLLLVCDSCNTNVCHTYCANLDRIPDGEWKCSECIIASLGKRVKIENLLYSPESDSETD
jgi:hypothetical protein